MHIYTGKNVHELKFVKGNIKNEKLQPTKGCDYLICTLLIILLLFHWTPDSKVSDVVPPQPGLPAIIGNLIKASLAQIL